MKRLLRGCAAFFCINRWKPALILLIFAASPLAAQDSFARGEELFMQNQPAEALPFLTAALKEDAANVKAYLYLGAVYLQLDRGDEAIAVYLKALPRGGGETSQIAYNLGNIYYARNNDEMAVKYYTEAITADPSNAPAYLNRANALLRSGAKKEALSDYGYYLTLEPLSAKRAPIEQLTAFINGEFDAETEAEAGGDQGLAEEVPASLQAAGEQRRPEAAEAGGDQGLTEEVPASLQAAGEQRRPEAAEAGGDQGLAEEAPASLQAAGEQRRPEAAEAGGEQGFAEEAPASLQAAGEQRRPEEAAEAGGKQRLTEEVPASLQAEEQRRVLEEQRLVLEEQRRVLEEYRRFLEEQRRPGAEAGREQGLTEEDSALLQAAEEQRRLEAEAERKQRFLEEVSASLQAAGEETQGLSAGREGMLDYEGEFELAE